jgi:hypothetical protein
MTIGMEGRADKFGNSLYVYYIILYYTVYYIIYYTVRMGKSVKMVLSQATRKADGPLTKRGFKKMSISGGKDRKTILNT